MQAPYRGKFGRFWVRQVAFIRWEGRLGLARRKFVAPEGKDPQPPAPFTRDGDGSKTSGEFAVWLDGENLFDDPRGSRPPVERVDLLLQFCRWHHSSRSVRVVVAVV